MLDGYSVSHCQDKSMNREDLCWTMPIEDTGVIFTRCWMETHFVTEE